VSSSTWGSPPPALTPVARTVGQVIAETLKLYGDNFLQALVLGIPFAAGTILTHWLNDDGSLLRPPGEGAVFDRKLIEQTLLLFALSPFFTAAYVRACVLEGRDRVGARPAVTAILVGTLVFLPAAITLGWFNLLGVAWLGVAGWVVPVLVHERVTVGQAFRRTLMLFRADPAHAIGGLAALVIVYGLTRGILEFLLRDQAGNGIVAAAALADLVISPVIFLGAALVYRDLAARVGTTKEDRERARAEAFADR
jgi:hypothetical protein